MYEPTFSVSTNNNSNPITSSIPTISVSSFPHHETLVVSNNSSASSFFNSLPQNSSLPNNRFSLFSKCYDFTKATKRSIFQNEKMRKYIRKTREFIEFTGDFSRRDLLNIVLENWKVALMSLLLGLIIGSFFLSTVGHSKYD